MKARRDWTKAARLAAVAAGALALVGVGPVTAAQAQMVRLPVYRCVALIPEQARVEGRDCETVNGGPVRGPIVGEFFIEDMRGLAVRCEPVRPVSGFADLPERVVGRFCRPLY